MSHIDPGPLATYESLADPHLTGYFNNTRMRKHLRRMGLITAKGSIVSENAFRLNNARKEHQRHIRDVLAQAIIHKALDMERYRQMHIKKQLEEIGKVERVRRVRADRALRGDEAVLPLLSPRHGKKKYHRPLSSHETQEKVPILQTVTDERKEDTSDDPYFMNSAETKSHYPIVEIDKQHLYNLDREALRSFTLNLSNFDLGSGVSPYTVPVLDQKGQPTKVKRRRPATATGVVHRGKVDGGLGRPKSNVRSLRLHRREPPMMYHTQLHTLCEVTFKYLGKIVYLDHEEEDPRDEVMVMQQHCGGENLCVFKKLIMKGDKFTLVSRRHRTFPFSLTFYLNGIQVERLSTCCEYKHKPGHKLGAKSSHFGLIKVEGSQPCFRCLIAKGKLKTKSDPTPPPTGRPSRPTRKRPKRERKTARADRSSESSKSDGVHSDVQHDAGNPMNYSESSSEVSTDSESTISDVSDSDEDRNDEVSSETSESTAKDKDESDLSDSSSNAESVESIKKVESVAPKVATLKDDASKASTKEKDQPIRVKKSSSKPSSSSSESGSDESAKVKKEEALKKSAKKTHPKSSLSSSDSEQPVTIKRHDAAIARAQKKERPSDKEKTRKPESKSSSTSSGSNRKKVTTMKKEDEQQIPAPEKQKRKQNGKKASSKSSSSSSESYLKKAAAVKNEPKEKEKVKKGTSSTSSESHHSTGKETNKKQAAGRNTLKVLPDSPEEFGIRILSNMDKHNGTSDKEREKSKTPTPLSSESSSSSDSVKENLEKQPVAQIKEEPPKSDAVEPTKSPSSSDDASSSSSSDSSTHSNKFKGSILPLIRGKTSVDLSNIKLDPDQCEELIKYFREDRSLLQLEKVIFRGCNIDDKAGKKILKLLAMAKKIKVLDLGNNKFTDRCTDLLLEICQKNPLEDFSIDRNPLRNEGCESLVDGLLRTQVSVVTTQVQKRISQSLIAAVLLDSKKEIAEEYKQDMSSTSSASSLASSAVSDNVALKTLNISYVGAGSSAFEKIGSYLALNPRLVELNISGNAVNHESLKVVLNPLGEGVNSNLKYLRIDDASLDDKSAEIIHDKLAAKAGLYEISLAGNKFTEEGIQKLTAYQEGNASLGKLRLAVDSNADH